MSYPTAQKANRETITGSETFGKKSDLTPVTNFSLNIINDRLYQNNEMYYDLIQRLEKNIKRLSLKNNLGETEDCESELKIKDVNQGILHNISDRMDVYEEQNKALENAILILETLI